MHLRNAPTQLMKQQGYGTDYRYAHDEPNAYAAGVQYLPPELSTTVFYQPVDRGLEIKIQGKLAHLRDLDARAHSQSKLKPERSMDSYMTNVINEDAP